MTAERKTASPYQKAQRKRAFIFMAILAACTIFLFPALADSYTYPTSAFGSRAGEMLVAIMEPRDDVTDMTRITVSFNGSNINGATITSICGRTFSNASGFMTAVNGIQSTLIGIALALCIATFCIGYLQAFIEDGGQQYSEVILKKFTLFGTSIAAIFTIGVICLLVIDLGTGIIDAAMSKFSSAVSSQNTTALVQSALDVIKDNCDTSSKNPIKILTYMVSGIGYIFELLIPWLITQFSWIVIQMVCWARALEIFVVECAAPFGFIDLSGRSAIDKGMRFVHNFFAIVLQGLVIVLVLNLSGLLRTTIISEDIIDSGGGISSTGMVAVCVLSLVQVTMVGRSRDIAKSIVG